MWFFMKWSAGIILGVGLFVGLLYFAFQEETNRKQRIVQFGYDARLAGVDSVANPYQYDSDRIPWLRGWMQANDELKKQK